MVGVNQEQRDLLALPNTGKQVTRLQSPLRRLWLFRRVLLASVRASDRVWPDPRQRLRPTVSPLRLRQLVSHTSLLLAVERELIPWKIS